jgi:hypothetical protein
VVRNHDAIGTERQRPLGIFRMENALEHEFTRPAIAQFLRAFPI